MVEDDFVNAMLPNDCESTSEFRFWITDDCGVETQCLQKIIQRDTAAPVILNCPDNLSLSVETSGLNDQISVWLNSFDAMDNCNNTDLELATNYMLQIQEFDCGDMQDVVFMATDRCGNVDSSCVANIDIFNELQPTITCPPDTIVKCNDSNILSNINQWLTSGSFNSLDSALITTDFNFDDVDLECSAPYQQEVLFTVTDRCGNTDECSAFINFIPTAALYIPNMFSPSGTGEDRFFSIRSNVAIENITSFRIFDRWGNVMYEKENFDPNVEPGWDGRNNFGNHVQGVYVYQIEYTDIFGNDFFPTGTLTLIE